MNTSTTSLPRSEFVDRINVQIAILMILMAIGLSATIAKEFMSQEVLAIASYGAWIFKGVLILQMAWLAYLIVNKWRARKDSLSGESFSFTSHIVLKATAASWVVGIILISLDNKLFASVPAENPITFMSHFLHVAMFGTYGIVFLLLNRNAEAEE